MPTASGFNPIHVGALPPQCAALNNVSVAVEEMAVEACLTGDPTMVYHAICYDPLDRRRALAGRDPQMVNEMLAQNRDYLPTFHISSPERLSVKAGPADHRWAPLWLSHAGRASSGCDQAL